MVKNLTDCIASKQRVVDFKITLLDALKMARAAVTPATIAKYFQEGGFVSTTEQKREDELLVTLCE